MNEGSARILHPPADIWNLELRVRRPVIARKLGLDRDAQLVLGAVNAKHAVHGQLRSNAPGDFSVEPVPPKSDLGVPRALQNLLAHFPVAPVVAGLPAGRVEHGFSENRPAGRVELQFALLAMERT